MVTPCSTLEQRWGACRARVYGEERVSEFAWCNLWKPYLTRGDAMAVKPWLNLRGNRRPCTSPKRPQCRAGTISWRGPALGFCDNDPF